MPDHIVTRLRAVSSDYGDAMREAANIIEELTADRDRWRKIALWNLEMAGYDNPEEHVQLCYYEDGTYHGGAR